MMIARILALCLAGVATATNAHDFWLQPMLWQASPHEPIGLTMQVGHGPYRQRSPIPGSRIVRFEAVAPNGHRIDLRKELHVGALTGDATITFGMPGIYSILLETDNRAESHLPAIRFNDYLEAEGLTPALTLRARIGKRDADGAENYSRHARTFVQVGSVDPRERAQVVHPAGLKLEIVPEINPQMLGRGGTLPVRVFYRGKPLPGTLVKLNDLENDAQPKEVHRSDEQGRAVFAIPRKGSWQINVIWTEPQPRTSMTDFDTSFSSLSFGSTS